MLGRKAERERERERERELPFCEHGCEAVSTHKIGLPINLIIYKHVEIGNLSTLFSGKR